MSDLDFIKNPLIRAVCTPDAEAVRRLVAEGASLQVQDGTMGTPLSAAVANKDVPMLKLLLELGADPNFAAKHRGSPLSDAALQKSLEMVQALLAAGADVHAERDGDTPLISALCSENLAVVDAVLAAGADLFRPNKHGQTGLNLSRTCRNPKVVARVLEAARAAADKVGLLDAVRIGAAERVRTLLADPETASPLKTEAAVLAVEEGQVECLRLLLAAGVDPNAQRPKKSKEVPAIPLVVLAAWEGKDAVVEALLAAGADVNATGNLNGRTGTTALRAAAEGKLALVKKLVAAGANPNLRDSAGDSPLSAAQKFGKAPVVRYLEGLAAQPPAAGATAATLHEACRDGLVDVARSLLDAGADPSALGKQKLTPLMLALDAGRADLVRLLLERGADWTVPASDGFSPWRRAMRSRAAAESAGLLLAAAAGRLHLLLGPEAKPEQVGELWSWGLMAESSAEVVARLLEAGLDPKAKLDDEGDVPIAAAIRWNGRDVVEVVQRLLAAGADLDGEYEDHGLRAGGSRFVSLLELAKQNSKKAYAYLRERLDVPADRYDLAEEVLKGLVRAAGADRFVDVARKLAVALKATPGVWKKRPGAVHFRAKLDKLFPQAPDAPFVPAVERIDALRQRARKAGAQLLYVGPPADEGEPTSLVLLPTDDWAAAIRAVGTSGPNHGLTCRELVARLADWAETHPFELFGAGPDFVHLRFLSPIESWRELYSALGRLCPDFRDDDADEAALAAFFRHDRRCFLWWD